METYKYFGILERDTIKQSEMKEKIEKKHLRKTRKILESKQYRRNLIKEINTWPVLFVGYLQEDLQAFKIASMHRYNDSKTT